MKNTNFFDNLKIMGFKADDLHYESSDNDSDVLNYLNSCISDQIRNGLILSQGEKLILKNL